MLYARVVHTRKWIIKINPNLDPKVLKRRRFSTFMHPLI